MKYLQYHFTIDTHITVTSGVNSQSPLCTLTVYIVIDGREVDLQYSDWHSGYPAATFLHGCAVATRINEWFPIVCDTLQSYVCQS